MSDTNTTTDTTKTGTNGGGTPTNGQDPEMPVSPN
jgi:hypothetical protein